MKEAITAATPGCRSNSAGGGRSESEKEKTKLRERKRRATTTKIFHGLRKWGGYSLSPRADINEVLRELAKEAGWVVEPDGTTYRAPAPVSIPVLVRLFLFSFSASILFGSQKVSRKKKKFVVLFIYMLVNKFLEDIL